MSRLPDGGRPLNPTILPTALRSHKYRRILGLAVAVALTPQSSTAQEVDTVRAITPAQAGSFVAAGALFGAGRLLDINKGPPECVPCDPLEVPAFDRWMIRPPVGEWSTASDVLILGLGTATLAHSATRENGWRGVVVGLETMAWTLGLTEVSKAVIGRYRPVLYTEDAVEAADELSNQRSMPSGHTSTAFALATAYWLNNPDVGLAPKLTAMAAAVGVGALRVVAARHFPSDVVVGAVLGTGVAFALHTIRF